MKKTLVEFKNVSKQYFLKRKKRFLGILKQKEKFFALNTINLKIKESEKVAILGDNGSGKTTLLKLIAGIAEPSFGSVHCFGKVVSLIDITAGFHQDFTGRENIYLNAILLGFDSKIVKSLEQDIISFAGLDQFIDQPLFTYSSGMMLRLGFSVAVHADPDILILDEGFIVGDQDFQKKAYDKVEEMFAGGKVIVMSSHILSILKRLCNRFIWLESGQIIMDGGQEVLLAYQKKTLGLRSNKQRNKKASLLFKFLKSLPSGETFFATATSGSMEPLILKGDRVEIQRVDYSNLKKGQVIAFWSEDLEDLMIHRIYKIEKAKIITKGDSNLAADFGNVKKSNFLGRVLDY